MDWVDDPDSRVDVLTTAVADLRGIVRLGRALANGTVPIGALRAQLGRAPVAVRAPGVPAGLARQLVRFAAVGVFSTLAYVLLYSLMRAAMPAQAANFLALGITAVANTAANRRLTFGVRGRERAGRHQLEGLVVFGLGLALTSGSLALLDVLTEPSRMLELSALVLANLIAAVLRFVLLRGWVFNPRRTIPKELT